TRELVIGCTFLTIVYYRTFHPVYFCIGAILTTIIAKVMKHVIRQPRPLSNNKKDKKGYGMPSSHSQAIAFFTTYIHCAFLSHSHKTTGMYMFTLCFHLFSIAVIWSRVRLGHHTEGQVLAGTALGILCALIWYGLWGYFENSIVHKLFDRVVFEMTEYILQ
ncbi:phosphatidic acid phosphatase type 2/haloperoxidase, partial [Pilobolus umbonatus]